MPTNVVINTLAASSFKDQKPGTSGLRKKVAVFKQSHYTHHFIQAILNTIPVSSNQNDTKTLVVGGDGRYYNKEALHIIIKMVAAHKDKINHLIVGKDAILSTPAVSNLIIKHKALGESL
jgi:phosphoglucomutase